MYLKNLFIIAAAVIAGQCMPAQHPSTAHKEDSELVYVIYVSRHGVRSPTGNAELYNHYSSAAWPSWSVAPGYLTPHGYQLMKLFGAYDGRLLRSEHLLSGQGCADTRRVTFRADSDERTQETAKALAEGIFPGCAVAIDALKEGTNDPLFHLPANEIKPADAALAASAIQGRIGNDVDGVTSAYRASLSNLESVLADCGTPVPDHSRASLLNIPGSVTPGEGDHIAEMRGPLNTAATLTENFLLEYTEDLDAKDVGWGCVDGTNLRTFINLHTVASDLALRTSAVAIPQSANLLQAIDRSIQQVITGKPVAGAIGKPLDKVLFLVGHDTNLSNIAGALRLNWLIDGRRDDTPPGSALLIQLWRSPAKREYSVRLQFTTQTLEQMRNASLLDLDSPPPQVPVFVPECSRADMSCEVSEFHHLLQGATRRDDRVRYELSR
jgi:4-phytase/acid phosphatase